MKSMKFVWWMVWVLSVVSRAHASKLVVQGQVQKWDQLHQQYGNDSIVMMRYAFPQGGLLADLFVQSAKYAFRIRLLQPQPNEACELSEEPHHVYWSQSPDNVRDLWLESASVNMSQLFHGIIATNSCSAVSILDWFETRFGPPPSSSLTWSMGLFIFVAFLGFHFI
jgi:hypothetical protein